MNKLFLAKSISIAIMLGILYILINSSNKAIVIFNNSLIIIIAIFISIIAINYYFYKEEFSLSFKYRNVFYNIIDYSHIILLTSFVIQICFLYIFFPATVTKTSMYPNLAENQRVIVVHNNNYYYERFDIVIFRIDSNLLTNVSPGENDELWIKRVIGLPGETVSFKYGKLYINNELVTEDFLLDNDGYPYHGQNDDQGKIVYYDSHTNDFDISDTLLLMNLEGDVIPEGYYLLLGDNRKYSTDSRKIGLVPESLIIGKAKYLVNNIFNWEKLSNQK